RPIASCSPEAIDWISSSSVETASFAMTRILPPRSEGPFLRVGEPWQPAEGRHELPDLFLALRGSEGWHAGHADAIRDDPFELAVRAAWTRARVRPTAGGFRLAPPSDGSTPGAPWQTTQWVRNRERPTATAAGVWARGLATLEAWRAIERLSAKVASRCSKRPGGWAAEKSTTPAARAIPTQRAPTAGSRSNWTMVRMIRLVRTSYST